MCQSTPQRGRVTPFPGPGRGVPPSQVQVGGTPFPGGGYPIPGGALPASWMRYPPHPDLGREYPPAWTWEGGTPHQVRSQDGEEDTCNRNSIACTCYAVGGVPLKFTQDDFLVFKGVACPESEDVKSVVDDCALWHSISAKSVDIIKYVK